MITVNDNMTMLPMYNTHHVVIGTAYSVMDAIGVPLHST